MRRAALILAASVAIGGGFAGGYYKGFMSSISLHGDLLPIRQGGKCGAYDPNNRSMVGEWFPRGGMCHMADYLRSKLHPGWK